MRRFLDCGHVFHAAWAGMLAVILLGGYSSTSWAVEVLPGQGVSFAQVDYEWDAAPMFDSNTGQLEIDISLLQASTGLSEGYVNVYTSAGWVLQNIPISSTFSTAYSGLQTSFALDVPSGTDVSSLTGHVDFSPNPIASPSPGTTRTFEVGVHGYNASGKNDAVGSGLTMNPWLGILPWAGLFAPTVVQADHKVVETADNQCGPEAAASSLQWLEDNKGVKIKHDHKKGIRNDPASNDALVAQLEEQMGRTVRDRADGDPVTDNQFLTGKLKYLNREGLSGLVIRHQDDEFGDRDFTEGTATSKGQGKKPTWEFIYEQLKKGEDVELGYTWKYKDAAGNWRYAGHWVEVVAAGKTLGIPWIKYVSDHKQTKKDAGGNYVDDDKGIGSPDFTPLFDTDGDGLLNMVFEKNNPWIDIVVTESVPEPSALLVLGSGLVGLFGAAKKRRAGKTLRNGG